MIHFKIAPHTSRPGVEVVEVFVGETFLGVITPDDAGRGIRIISKYLENPALALMPPDELGDPGMIVINLLDRPVELTADTFADNKPSSEETNMQTTTKEVPSCDRGQPMEGYDPAKLPDDFENRMAARRLGLHFDALSRTFKDGAGRSAYDASGRKI